MSYCLKFTKKAIHSSKNICIFCKICYEIQNDEAKQNECLYS